MLIESMSSPKLTTWSTKQQSADGLRVTLIKKKPKPPSSSQTKRDVNWTVGRANPTGSAVLPNSPRWTIESNENPCRLTIKRRARMPIPEDVNTSCRSGDLSQLKMRLLASAKPTQDKEAAFTRVKNWCKEQISNSVSSISYSAYASSEFSCLFPSPKHVGLETSLTAELFHLQPSPKDSGIDVNSPPRKFDETQVADSSCISIMAVSDAECGVHQSNLCMQRHLTSKPDSKVDGRVGKKMIDDLPGGSCLTMHNTADDYFTAMKLRCAGKDQMDKRLSILGKSSPLQGTVAASVPRPLKRMSDATNEREIIPEKLPKRNMLSVPGRKLHAGSRNSASRRSFERWCLAHDILPDPSVITSPKNTGPSLKQTANYGSGETCEYSRRRGTDVSNGQLFTKELVDDKQDTMKLDDPALYKSNNRKTIPKSSSCIYSIQGLPPTVESNNKEMKAFSYHDFSPVSQVAKSYFHNTRNLGQHHSDHPEPCMKKQNISLIKASSSDGVTASMMASITKSSMPSKSQPPQMAESTTYVDDFEKFVGQREQRLDIDKSCTSHSSPEFPCVSSNKTKLKVQSLTVRLKTRGKQSKPYHSIHPTSETQTRDLRKTYSAQTSEPVIYANTETNLNNDSLASKTNLAVSDCLLLTCPVSEVESESWKEGSFLDNAERTLDTLPKHRRYAKSAIRMISSDDRKCTPEKACKSGETDVPDYVDFEVKTENAVAFSESSIKTNDRSLHRFNQTDELSLGSFISDQEKLCSIQDKVVILLKILFPNIISSTEVSSKSVCQFLDSILDALGNSASQNETEHDMNYCHCHCTVMICRTPKACLETFERQVMNLLQLFLPSIDLAGIDSSQVETLVDAVTLANAI